MKTLKDKLTSNRLDKLLGWSLIVFFSGWVLWTYADMAQLKAPEDYADGIKIDCWPSHE